MAGGVNLRAAIVAAESKRNNDMDGREPGIGSLGHAA
jgi:hypothetical protein